MGAFVQSQQQAWMEYDALANDPRVTYLDEPMNIETEFRALSNSESPSHFRWTDCYLAGFAAAAGASIVTFDISFLGGPNLQIEKLS